MERFFLRRFQSLLRESLWTVASKEEDSPALRGCGRFHARRKCNACAGNRMAVAPRGECPASPPCARNPQRRPLYALADPAATAERSPGEARCPAVSVFDPRPGRCHQSQLARRRRRAGRPGDSHGVCVSSARDEIKPSRMTPNFASSRIPGPAMCASSNVFVNS